MRAVSSSHKPAPTGQAGQIFYRVKRKSSLVSHFLPPADLWSCCISVVPALAAAQHPPAPPSAAAEHPNEKEIKETCTEDLNTDISTYREHPPTSKLYYPHRTNTCTFYNKDIIYVCV